MNFSYEKLCINVPGPSVASHGTFSSVSSRVPSSGFFPCDIPRHNQRRGAIVGDDPLSFGPNPGIKYPKTVDSSHCTSSLILKGFSEPRQHLQTLDVRMFEEIELNVRSHLSKSLVLDNNPDSIVAISTPSS